MESLNNVKKFQNWITALNIHDTEPAYVKPDMGSDTGSFKLNEWILFLQQVKANGTRSLTKINYTEFGNLENITCKHV